MRRLAFALALALALTGCAGTLDPGDKVRAVGFRQPELAALQAAVDEWNEAAPALGLTLTVFDGDWTISRANFNGEKYGHASELDPLIRIDADLLARHFPGKGLAHLQSTAMHEIGHALGLRGHAPAGLMKRYHTGQTCIDDVTLAWLWRERPELGPGMRPTCP